MAASETPGTSVFLRSGSGYFVLKDFRSVTDELLVAGPENWLAFETLSIEGHRFSVEVRCSEVVSVNEVTDERWLWTLNDALEQRERAGFQAEALAVMKDMRDQVARDLGPPPDDEEGGS